MNQFCKWLFNLNYYDGETITGARPLNSYFILVCSLMRPPKSSSRWMMPPYGCVAYFNNFMYGRISPVSVAETSSELECECGVGRAEQSSKYNSGFIIICS